MNVNTRKQLPDRLAGSLVVGAIRVYRMTLSRVLPSSCRFAPSCSEYTMEAVQRFGVLRGLWMGLRRISKCHPFHPGGYDPVEHR